MTWERIEALFCPEPNTGCWLWCGYVEKSGYGRVGWHGRRYMAHRLVYERHKGPVPAGLTLDHLCRNRGCVNPEHLEPVTSGENVLRGEGVTARSARRSCCAHGHKLSGANLYTDKRGRRACRQCRNKRSIAFAKTKYASDPQYRERAKQRARESEQRRRREPSFKAARREIQRKHLERKRCLST